jgi:hypothetical protein
MQWYLSVISAIWEVEIEDLGLMPIRTKHTIQVQKKKKKPGLEEV